jgi:hypothetical protein
MAFYKRAGFQEVQLDLAGFGKIPKWLLFEAAAGTVVAKLAAGQRLCVMFKRT